MRHRPGIHLGACTVLAALLAGCGGSSTTPTTVAPTTRPSPTTVPRRGTPLRFGAPHALSPGTGLVSVSCGSATSCIALDAVGRAYRSDGTTWSGPVPATGQALGPGSLSVSCSGPSACMAVTTAASQVVAWNGQVWSVPSTLDGATGLEAVGCAPTGYCASVDSEGNAFAFAGRSWQATSGDWGSVSSISCVSASFCMSVSGGISQWNGAQWSMPDPFTGTSSFSGVSCASVTFCAAVDLGGEVLQWNGQSWSSAVRVETGQVSATSSGIALTGVSCPTATFCTAVDNSGGVLEWSNGTWTRFDVDGTEQLDAVSCPTASYCVAVDRGGNVLVGTP
ncbi:MAG: hypothetical protein ABSF84_09265 [Acidimicrobiales bacterium]